ncbi:unnamed protein product [Pseudo-nitzschia multistriata]|uniref:Uncharacterized protein n=1 Tax=Pseudo-nitzschia multistriata TaxID=183589 RepID=A0A448Z4C0_9STRA|nr:unnamed protein product [Pseudo-nitzschia multistriata]
MKLFKSSKKKNKGLADGSEKEKRRSSLFGKGKKQKQRAGRTSGIQSTPFPDEADDAVTARTSVLSPASSSGGRSSPGFGDAHRPALGHWEGHDHDHSGSSSHSNGDKNVGNNVHNDDDDDDDDERFLANLLLDESDHSGEGEAPGAGIPSSSGLLEKILTHLTEQEHREWAAGAGDDNNDDCDEKTRGNDEPAEKGLRQMLRRTVDCMDHEPHDLLVQQHGTRIVYKLAKKLFLRRREKEQRKARRRRRERDLRWYEDDHGGDGSGDRTGKQKTSPEPSDNNDHDDNDDDHDEYQEETNELILDASDTILQAMEDFPDDEALLEDSCLALEVLTDKNYYSKNYGNANRHAAPASLFDTKTTKRILEEILMTMEGFADNPVVVSSSLGLLGNLSSTTTTTSKSQAGGSFSSPNHDDLRRKLARYAIPSILHGMREHRDDAELYTKGCKALANFTRDNPSAQHHLACKENLGLRIVAEGLNRGAGEQNPNELVLLQNLGLRSAALVVLKHLSTHPSLEVKGKIALGGGAARIVDRLLQVLQQTGKELIENNYQVEHSGRDCGRDCGEDDEDDDDDEVGISLSVLQDALQTLENLADIEGVVTKDDPRSPHLPTLHRSPHSAATNSAEDIQKQLTKAVKPVLNTVLQHPNRPSVQYRGLCCIQRLTLGHADAIANHYGGISTLLNVLSSPSPEAAFLSPCAGITESDIHQKALACLTGLLSPSSNADGLELVASMETEDGLATIFRTVRMYQSRPELISSAFEALFYLSCRARVVLASIAEAEQSRKGASFSHFSHGAEAEAARKLRDQLCLEENVFVLVGTIQQYLQADESICQRGLGILLNVQAFLIATAAEADEGEPRRQSQSQPHSHSQPRSHAPPTQRDVLASNGGIKLVLAVMRLHGLAVAIQEYGVGLLASMLGSGSNNTSNGHTPRSRAAALREFFDEEGIVTVISAMVIHPDHALIQSTGCDVLIRLVVVDHSPYNLLEADPEATAEAAFYKRCILEDTNARAVVEDALERFPTQKYLQHRGAILLGALSSPGAGSGTAAKARNKAALLRNSVTTAAAASFSTALSSSNKLLSSVAAASSSPVSRG